MFVLLIIPFNSQDLLIVSYSAISTAVLYALYALYAFMWTVVVTEEEKIEPWIKLNHNSYNL